MYFYDFFLTSKNPLQLTNHFTNNLIWALKKLVHYIARTARSMMMMQTDSYLSLTRPQSQPPLDPPLLWHPGQPARWSLSHPEVCKQTGWRTKKVVKKNQKIQHGCKCIQKRQGSTCWDLRGGTDTQLFFVGTCRRSNFIEETSAKARSWDQ